ncbi:HNH endonuclease [Vibrio sp. 10N.261.55.A10]|uniref:HNH endonuclease n=1 Tax=Vibrio sp. 10N.261.55.A10 TaxID=3229687 RepID=UPI003551162E
MQCKALQVKEGYYAKGSHIKPVMRPQSGPDSLNNLLCLRPNHHVIFDRDSFSIANDLSLLGIERGSVLVKHELSIELLEYPLGFMVIRDLTERWQYQVF